jgi:hypothetical protein
LVQNSLRVLQPRCLMHSDPSALRNAPASEESPHLDDSKAAMAAILKIPGCSSIYGPCRVLLPQ